MNATATATATAASPTTTTEPDRRAASSPTVRALRRRYLWALGWAFALFNTVRVFAYLPTLWAIHLSGDSSQHSLWTWVTWIGANATMAAWLYEQNGGRANRAVVVSAGNATMCLATTLAILWYRL